MKRLPDADDTDLKYDNPDAYYKINPELRPEGYWDEDEEDPLDPSMASWYAQHPEFAPEGYWDEDDYFTLNRMECNAGKNLKCALKT